jgi:hypothetical protein
LVLLISRNIYDTVNDVHPFDDFAKDRIISI